MVVAAFGLILYLQNYTKLKIARKKASPLQQLQLLVLRLHVSLYSNSRGDSDGDDNNQQANSRPVGFHKYAPLFRTTPQKLKLCVHCPYQGLHARCGLAPRR